MIPAFLKNYMTNASLGALALAAVVVGYFEGYKPTPYLDPVGILTVCTGHTGGVELRTYSKAECEALLKQDLAVADIAVARLLKVPVGRSTRAGLMSFTLNVGETQLRNSTLLRLLNAGAGAQACDQLRFWVWGKDKKTKEKKKLPGLVIRREVERALCIQGFSEVQSWN